jgi:hypothetical protein
MNTPEPRTPWQLLLAYGLPILLALASAFFGWVTGVQPKLETHGKDIEVLKTEQRQQGTKIDRVETKIDRLLERPK